MKKILKSFTFEFLMLSLIIILLGQLGQDSKNILLIGFNPILNLLSRNSSVVSFFDEGVHIACNNIDGYVSVYWYILSIVTSLLYGYIIDMILYRFKQK